MITGCGSDWEHETANAQLKTYLRGPGKVLRSESPDMIEQELRPTTQAADRACRAEQYD
jgi:hypothetical protein